MSVLEPLFRTPLRALGSLLTAAAVGVVGVSAVGGFEDEPITVHRVIDGDTIVVIDDGEQVTVRLLNIDTPETKDPDEPVQCMGPEATAFLTERLPAGTEVELEYDKERTDDYGRTLAAVFVSDALINAEIARAGLGVPMVVEPNRAFFRDVLRAAQAAEHDGIGLYDESIGCTPYAALQTQSALVQELPAVPPLSKNPADALVSAEEALEESSGIVAGFDAGGLQAAGWTVYAVHAADTLLGDLREEAGRNHRAIERRVDELRTAEADYKAEQKRIKEEKKRKEKEERERKERERKEREERERREREEREAREREERERREREAKAPAPTTPPAAPKETPKEKPTQKPAPKPRDDESSTAPSSGGSGGSGGSTPPKSGGSGGSSGSSCVPYGRVYSYDEPTSYTGKRYGMPGGKGWRKCR